MTYLHKKDITDLIDYAIKEFLNRLEEYSFVFSKNYYDQKTIRLEKD